MISGKLGGASAVQDSVVLLATASGTIPINASFGGNSVGVRVFVTVTAGATVCICEDEDGTGGWRVPNDGNSYELGVFDPSEDIDIIGLAEAATTVAYTLVPVHG